ncbi:MAG: hypothetical protein AB1798_22670 [Spirochaetota bacterium]
MKVIYLVVLLLLCCGYLPAETVMVYVEDENTSGAKPENRDSLALALEGSIMDGFFENGHIVFNAGMRKDESSNRIIKEKDEIGRVPQFRQEDLPVLTAKSGGAYFLLDVKLCYNHIKFRDEPVLASARFTFYDLISDEKIGEGIITSDFTAQNTPPNSEASSVEIGRRIIQEVLRLWQP